MRAHRDCVRGSSIENVRGLPPAGDSRGVMSTAAMLASELGFVIFEGGVSVKIGRAHV